MSKMIIKGNKMLSGVVHVAPAKNHVLKVLPLCLMMEGEMLVNNVPYIDDVSRMLDLLSMIGVNVVRKDRGVILKVNDIKNELVESSHQKIRSSIMIAAPALHATGNFSISYPGGCVLGKRPIDIFLDGFRSFGVDVVEEGDQIKLAKTSNLRAAKIIFPRVSHTATESMMTFATKVAGVTRLINAACEPEIVALADYLNSCGAKISGAGTPFITIEGVDKLYAKECVIIPDRIEAGTFAILAALVGSDIEITGFNPNHLDILWEYFDRLGVNFKLYNDRAVVNKSNMKVNGFQLVTHEYPGFPTDLQPPMTLLLTQSIGKATVFETIYEGRLYYTDMLNQMGADITMCDPHRVIVNGKTDLTGKKLASPDLRAGMTLVMAGLLADGVTEIDNLHHIDRGYENLTERLTGLGAEVERIEENVI